MTTKARSELLGYGHGLPYSCWSAWCAAVQYADEIKSPLVPLIDRGADYAERGRPVPKKYLDAALRLYRQAIDSRRAEGQTC